MIYVCKLNEIYVRIVCPRNVALEIFGEFSYRPDGYQWDIRYKNGVWDGYIHLFKKNDYTFPIGLIPQLIRFLKREEYEYEIDPELRLVNVDKTVDFIKSEYDKLTLSPYDYQENAFEKVLRYNRGLILSPTSSGKSFIIYLILKGLLLEIPTDRKILISVPSKGLVQQLAADLESYEKVGNPVSRHVHKLVAGAPKETNRRILLGTWAMILKQKDDFFEQFDGFVVDEAHQAKTDAFRKVIGKLHHTRWRFGLTGTLDGSLTHEMQLRAWFGAVVTSEKTMALVERGIISPFVVRQVFLEYPDEICQLNHRIPYKSEIDFIVENELRNDFIVKTAMTRNANVLVLFSYVRHGKALFELANKHPNAKEKDIQLIYGAVGTDEREKIRVMMEKKENVVLFANYQTTSVGISIKNLHYVMFVHPYKAQIRILQSIGRGLRLHSDKDRAIVLDFVDDFRCGGWVNTLYKHGLDRFSIYNEEEFDVTQLAINLDN